MVNAVAVDAAPLFWAAVGVDEAFAVGVGVVGVGETAFALVDAACAGAGAAEGVPALLTTFSAPPVADDVPAIVFVTALPPAISIFFSYPRSSPP